MVAFKSVDGGRMERGLWRGRIVKDVKWLLKNWGMFLLILLIAVIVGSFMRVRWSESPKEVSEVVWEPPVEIVSNDVIETGVEEGETESEADLWFLPQAEDCLITDTEKEELKSMALTAAGQVKEVYKDIEITDELSYGSNIKEFTKEQCREVVSLLGNAGYVSVTEDTNMENYREIEDFYAAYREKRDAMVTIFDVNRDGLLGVITFIYRESELQTYYVGIGWQKGGIPEIRNTLVSDIAEIKLTEKGYFIYAHEIVIPHSSLRGYYRVKPLPDKCRELTAKYVYGLQRI